MTGTSTSTATGRTSPWSRDRFERGLFAILRRVTIGVALVVTVFPFYYMLMLSMRDLTSIVRDPGRIWLLPNEIDFSSYADVLTSVASGGQGFTSMIGNSGIVALGTVAATLAIAVPGAYAVSRLEFFGRRRIGVLFLAVYLFPTILLAVPLFVFFTKMGLRGLLPVLIVVYVSQTIAVAIFMLRNYFDTLPTSIEEAAALDGLGRLQTLWKIVLPLSLPSMMSTALFVFMIAWNEFLFALLFLVEDRSTWTVSLGLAQLSESLEIAPTSLMAGSVVLTLPIIILFFASERLLSGGLTAGAEKG
ncbi:carbohydrate ABC transporter permease [Zhihengliuella halotolerans]|uniref:carbohydrate ABC transporter permease n=1 Tax=Zhihengliuella halotolerans TaxID=370736 RepID=UPI000C7FD9EE|nr:carbohydrate ABC transporter permease [Zhihengliuella halotolerans]